MEVAITVVWTGVIQLQSLTQVGLQLSFPRCSLPLTELPTDLYILARCHQSWDATFILKGYLANQTSIHSGAK